MISSPLLISEKETKVYSAPHAFPAPSRSAAHKTNKCLVCFIILLLLNVFMLININYIYVVISKILNDMKKSIFSALCLVLLATTTQSAWGEEVTLSNANIVSMGTGSTSYKTYTATIDGYSWGAYAIKNYHSNATKTYHYLQIKKYASSTAYYIQLPTFAGAITSIKMTVSGTSQTMSGGENTATLYFSSSNSTSATGTGVASGSGASSVTIDCSSLGLKTGYITASGAVRIWDITVTYETGSTSTTLYLVLFLAALYLPNPPKGGL